MSTTKALRLSLSKSEWEKANFHVIYEIVSNIELFIKNINNSLTD